MLQESAEVIHRPVIRLHFSPFGPRFQTAPMVHDFLRLILHYLTTIILCSLPFRTTVPVIYNHQLKPRSVGTTPAAELPRSARPRSRSISSKGDPFGAALPREQVLKQRGIDPSEQDSRFELKAEVAHFTPEQEAEVEAVQAQLTKLEREWRNANENELPEEQIRTAAESKRTELNALMKKFHDINAAAAASEQNQYERPSERRHRKENDLRSGRNVIDEDTDGVFASFSSNRRRRRQSMEEQAF